MTIPKLNEITDLRRVPEGVWDYAPDALLLRARKAVERKIPTAIAMGRYEGKKYWLLLHVGFEEYIEQMEEA